MLGVTVQDQSKLVGDLLAVVREMVSKVGTAALPMAVPKKEAARLLGVRRTTLDSFIRTNQIRVFRYSESGHPYILTSDLVAFLAEKATETAPPDRRAPPLPTKKVPVRRARQYDAKAESAKLRAALRKR